MPEKAHGSLLLVCFGFDTLHYRVLLCAAETAREVVVLGTPETRWLASSRWCARFLPADFLGREPPSLEGCAEKIDQVASAHRADLIVPADGQAVRLLSRLRPHLRAPVFPVPDADTFDLLDDKWRFGQLCRALGVRHPASRLFDRREALIDELERGGLVPPIVVKPIDLAGSRGVHVLRSAADLAGARSLSYRPILAQSYVDGVDISLSVFCRSGRIQTEVVYRKQRGDCIFTTSSEFVRLAGQVLGNVGYDGVANFDARLDRDGRIHLLECNPRFWYTMDMTLLAGLNFVGLGRAGASERDAGQVALGAVLRSNRSLLMSLRRPWTMTAFDLAALRYRMRDPVPVLYEQLHKLRARITGDDRLARPIGRSASHGTGPNASRTSSLLGTSASSAKSWFSFLSTPARRTSFFWRASESRATTRTRR